jgi:hypothetical protein
MSLARVATQFSKLYLSTEIVSSGFVSLQLEGCVHDVPLIAGPVILSGDYSQ